MSEEYFASKENVTASAMSPKQDNLVDFDGPDDPLHPYNWPMKKRCALSLHSSKPS